MQRDAADTEGSSPGINTSGALLCPIDAEIFTNGWGSTNTQTCMWHGLSDDLNLITSFCGAVTVLFIFFLTNAFERWTQVTQWPRTSYVEICKASVTLLPELLFFILPILHPIYTYFILLLPGVTLLNSLWYLQLLNFLLHKANPVRKSFQGIVCKFD